MYLRVPALGNAVVCDVFRSQFVKIGDHDGVGCIKQQVTEAAQQAQCAEPRHFFDLGTGRNLVESWLHFR